MSHLDNEIALTVKIEGEAFTSWDGIDDAVMKTIADRLLSDHTLKLREKVLDGVFDHINKLIETKLTELLSKPIQPVNEFGERIEGQEPKTLSKILTDATQTAMEQTVNPYDGKPKKSTYHDKAIPRLEYLLRHVAIREIDTAVSKAVKQVNKEALAAVQDQTAKAISKHLAKA